MKFKVRCSKFESREDIHFKTQPGPVVWMCGNTLPALPYIYIYRTRAKSVSNDFCSSVGRALARVQFQAGGLEVAFFATGPG